MTDVTIPDGTVMAPGSAFTKTWQIRNVGSCTWTTSYALVHVFGSSLGVTQEVNLPSSVAPVVPGETADFSVNMVAPSTPGHYRDYWRFSDPSGRQFGVGWGMVTFFADINVVAAGPNTSTTTITAATPNPSTPGQAVAVSVNVSGSGITPTGTVSLNGADTNCAITLSGGSGSCNVIFNSPGTRTITATYSGDSNYAGSSTSRNQTVNSVSNSTTITITDTPAPSTTGQSVAVNITVSGSGATPTGWVVVAGADTTCTLTLSGGSGSCNVVFNTAGNRTLVAVYGGDSNYASNSTTKNHTVNQGTLLTSTTTITGTTLNPSTPGASVGVSVSVSGTGPTPTGTVSITGADTNCTMTLSSGTGSCNIVFNGAVPGPITAAYSGDSNYGVSSAMGGFTVNQGTPTINISAETPDPSTNGQSVAVSVNVAGQALPNRDSVPHRCGYQLHLDALSRKRHL